MKQKYMKPAIVMERFELSQSIADNCGATPGGGTLGRPAHWSKNSCGWFIDAETILWFDTGEFGSCNEHLKEGEDFDGLCYNNPAGGQAIFNS